MREEQCVNRGMQSCLCEREQHSNGNHAEPQDKTGTPG